MMKRRKKAHESVVRICSSVEFIDRYMVYTHTRKGIHILCHHTNISIYFVYILCQNMSVAHLSSGNKIKYQSTEKSRKESA